LEEGVRSCRWKEPFLGLSEKRLDLGEKSLFSLTLRFSVRSCRWKEWGLGLSEKRLDLGEKSR